MSTAHLPDLVAIPAGIVGLVMGSFAGVVASRVPDGQSIVSPPSRCDTCGAAVRSSDNIPVISYLLLRGRCRACSAVIPPTTLLIELATAGLFVLVSLRLAVPAALPAYLVLMTGLVALSAIDLVKRRLPTAVIYWTAGIGAVALLSASAATGRWTAVLDGFIGAAACFAVFFAIFFAAPRAMGYGDVRLATMCGGFLGWVGLGAVPVGIFAGFVIAGIPAAVLLALGKANRKTQLPFGPYLAAGTVIGVCFGLPLAHLWAGV